MAFSVSVFDFDFFLSELNKITLFQMCKMQFFLFFALVVVLEVS